MGPNVVTLTRPRELILSLLYITENLMMIDVIIIMTICLQYKCTNIDTCSYDCIIMQLR